MKDLLVGIFADSTVPEQLRKPSLSSVQPSFVEYGDGLVLAKGFDMDRALQDYEETLQDMLENGGFANPAVGQICAGLASLYDAKAGISKDAKFYDRAVEYIAMMQQAMQSGMGEAAMYDPTFLHLEGRKQKILRKKQRRLAKGPPGPELQQLLNQRPERRKE
ncbi:unnamed protein product [Effrenium voratum]|uniref:Uncharacterized protein n=1 Tax=Effrenium voratum TaxID=2562239 RepID=A0AA36HTV8_9DINO|nr:unnamed protein product [Effrenium voratum]CAJ1375251.1 unnamed protein product [Effrenium voratum]CAJ1433145.1 unnamed protein product [Effrenium voratum]CAJ1442529.1 unnamed protein product [Effrenium voratum]